MGKRAHAKAGRQDRGGQPGPYRDRGDPLELVDRLDSDVGADIRLLHADSVAADPLRALLGAENAGVPVAVIEPLSNYLVQNGEAAYDLRIAVATKMGLPLAGPIRPPVAVGWTLGPRKGKWELTDPTGTLIARCTVSPANSAGEALWTAHAMAQGQILIAYGMRVGVRVPDGVPASHYDDEYRAAELHKSLIGQQACAAIVSLSSQIGAFRPARSS
jgi:hypothetical protein